VTATPIRHVITLHPRYIQRVNNQNLLPSKWRISVGRQIRMTNERQIPQSIEAYQLTGIRK
jgi:hypothetical protein